MGNDVYEKFLVLTGFEEDEMADFLPEWRRACEKLGLTEDDIRFATEEWIPKHFEVRLEGVRKLLSSLVAELTDLTKANIYKQRGVKIVYGILPALLIYYYAIKTTAPDKVYVSFPDVFLTIIMNGLFHKLNPYLEEAERAGIPYGCRHCALNKTRYAARRLGVIPSPDVSWIWGFVCDEGPKTDEFIRMYDDPEWKTYITRIPRDQPMGTVEDEVDERVEYLANQMRDGFQFVQNEIGIEVMDEKLKEIMDNWRRYFGKLAELYRLIGSDPQPINGIIPALFSDPLFVPFNTGMERIENALDITIKEVEQRVSNKEGILPKGAPKLMIHVYPYGLPWITKMFEENGVGLTYSIVSVPTKKQLAPSRFEDPYMAAAETWLKRESTVNVGYKAELIREKMEKYGMDGMVFGFFDFDRWLGSDHILLARILEEKTKLPVFYIEGDVWEDRDYGPEALRTRIESICEVAKMRKS